MRPVEWFIGVLGLSLSALILFKSFELPQIAADPAGLALMPQIFASITGGAAVLLILRLVRDLLSSSAKAEVAESTSVPTSVEGVSATRRLLATAILTGLYPLVMMKLGFLLSTILYMGAILKVLGARPLPGAVVALVCPTVLFLVFDSLLNVYLPGGDWLALLFD